MKGSVIDLAVGVVIGGAFGKIVASLVGDVIMPALSPMLGSVNFTDLAVQIATNAAGKPVMLRYGAFLQTIFEFLVIALSLFIVIKGINRLNLPAPNASPPLPSPTAAFLAHLEGSRCRPDMLSMCIPPATVRVVHVPALPRAPSPVGEP